MIHMGFDPPRGWSVWKDGQLYAASQVLGDGPDVPVRCVREALAAMRTIARNDGGIVANVEIPYGLGDRSTVQSMLVEAEAAGVIRGMLVEAGIGVFRVTPSQWRAHWKFPGGLTREDCKALAVKISESCVASSTLPGCHERAVLRGPRGGLRVDAMEAICIGAVTRKPTGK